MSRIGKQPITMPGGVAVTVENGLVNVVGPKGRLQTPLLPGIKLVVEDGMVKVTRTGDEAIDRARHGLIRQLVNNMITGVNKGFNKKLELNGVGYRVSAQGQTLKFNLGFSHDVNYTAPEDVSVSVDQNIITVTGINKQQVGQVAAEIRALKKPEPYKGKGIKYIDEYVRRKSGKTGKEATV